MFPDFSLCFQRCSQGGQPDLLIRRPSPFPAQLLYMPSGHWGLQGRAQSWPHPLLPISRGSRLPVHPSPHGPGAVISYPWGTGPCAIIGVEGTTRAGSLGLQLPDGRSNRGTGLGSWERQGIMPCLRHCPGNGVLSFQPSFTTQSLLLGISDGLLAPVTLTSTHCLCNLGV